MTRVEAAKKLTAAAAEHRRAGHGRAAMWLEDGILEMTLAKRSKASPVAWAGMLIRAPEIWPDGCVAAKDLLVSTFEALED